MCPLLGAVSDPVGQRWRAHRLFHLGRGDVDLGVGEVGQPADVIGVEMRGDDVPHVGAVEAERLDLTHS